MRRRGFYTPWRAAVSKVFADTELNGLTFHELRHTASALAIAHGAHPQTIKERLGHASITTTMDRYGGLFPSADEALAEALEGSISKALLASRSGISSVQRMFPTRWAFPLSRVISS